MAVRYVEFFDLARVKGSQDDLAKLERECPEGGLSGWVM